jgi:predicted ATPase
LRGPALTPLVGRDEEIELLMRRWARAEAGNGQVVLVSGEAGFGKSRITAELEQRLYAEPHIQLRYFRSSYRQDSALFPHAAAEAAGRRRLIVGCPLAHARNRTPKANTSAQISRARSGREGRDCGLS